MNKLIIANWKMNPSSFSEANTIFSGIYNTVKSTKNIQVVVCPPFPFLNVGHKLKSSKVFLGSQNVSKEQEGSFTGEVSLKMLKSLGVKYIILGHSERRKKGETDKIINIKLSYITKSDITSILCVGENNRDSHGHYLSFIKHQITECLEGIPKSKLKNIVIAYEPVWAIGASASREATPEEFTEVRIFIRKIVSDLYDIKTAQSVRIIYGGSVNPQNAKSFLFDGGADGLLVGRDSLNIKKFGEIINAAK
jgi:triosephosphate isomerase